MISVRLVGDSISAPSYSMFIWRLPKTPISPFCQPLWRFCPSGVNGDQISITPIYLGAEALITFDERLVFLK